VGLHVVELGQVVDTGTADHGQGDLLHSKHSMKMNAGTRGCRRWKDAPRALRRYSFIA
jgi:hypothetical protein